MARYRHTWTNPTNGWSYRLDILPCGSSWEVGYKGATLSSTVTALPAGSIAEDGIGATSLGFADGRPLGLFEAPTMDFTLRWNFLPTALKNALQARSYQSARNVFLFYTDRGTGSTYTLEFAGTPEYGESIEYEITEEGNYEVTYTCRDCLSFALLELAPADIFTDDVTVWNPPGVYGDQFDISSDFLWEVASPSYNALDLRSDAEMVGRYGTMRTATFAQISDRFREYVSDWISEHLIRTENTADAAVLDCADADSRFADLIDTGARFRSAATSSPRSGAASNLTDATAHLVTHVMDNDFQTAGGLTATQDELGWAQAQSMHNVLKDLCETFFLKASWRPRYVTDGSGDYVDYVWDVACIFASGRANASPVVRSLDAKIEMQELLEGGSAIARAETRITTPGGVAERNVTEWVSANAQSRDGQAWTCEPILHNVPTWKRTFRPGSNPYLDDALTQTNLICYAETYGGVYAITKAHENTTIVLLGTANGGSATTTVAGTFNDDIPSLSLAFSFTPAQQAIVQAWLNTSQRAACLPYTLAVAALTAFGNEQQATTTVKWRIDAGTTPDNVSLAHELTDGEADHFDHLGWARAVIVSMTIDWLEGVSEITYFMPEP